MSCWLIQLFDLEKNKQTMIDIVCRQGIFTVLKRLYTSQEAFYYTIFIVRSPFLQHSQSIHTAFVHRPSIVHKAFTVHNSHYYSELQWERIYFYREKMKKERICKSGRKIKYKSEGILFPQVQHKGNYRTVTSLLHVQPDKTCWISYIAMKDRLILGITMSNVNLHCSNYLFNILRIFSVHSKL
jgi:hypothetical protein